MAGYYSGPRTAMIYATTAVYTVAVLTMLYDTYSYFWYAYDIPPPALVGVAASCMHAEPVHASLLTLIVMLSH